MSHPRIPLRDFDAATGSAVRVISSRAFHALVPGPVRHRPWPRHPKRRNRQRRSYERVSFFREGNADGAIDALKKARAKSQTGGGVPGVLGWSIFRANATR